MTLIDNLKSAPTRLSDGREKLSNTVRERAQTARNAGIDRLWAVRADTLERLDGLFDRAGSVPVVRTVAVPASKIIHERLDLLMQVSIEGYADMNARKAVQAIRALDSRVALHAVRRFEAATKGRKTVLNAIDTKLG